MGVDARPEGPPASLGHVTKGELCREQALVFWCDRPSDTQTGEISPKQTSLEHATQPRAGYRAVRLLPWGGGHDRPAHRSPHSSACPAGRLGWQTGDPLTFTAAAGVVIARRDPGGMVTMASKPYLVIPDQANAREGPDRF